MPVHSAKVEWQRLDQGQFDRIVEALLIRYHQELRDGSQAEALDGRGGDGGRDVDVHLGGKLTTIYQLKFFPEGFSGGHAPSRKRQIRRSFEKAMEDSPRTWALVIPRNPTVEERKWVQNLKEKRRVRIEIWGRARIDAELAKFPDLARWAARDDEFIAAVTQAGQEKAALLGPHDLAERLRDLKELGSSRSQYWDTEMSADADGNVTEVLIAKRPDASEKEPINLKLTIDAAAMDQDEREKLDHLERYGVGEATITGRAIREFVVEGPDWIAGERSVDRLVATAFPQGETAVSLLACSRLGLPVASVRGTLVRMAPGTDGRALQAIVPGGLTMTFLLPHGGDGGRVNITFAPTGVDAEEAGRSLTFLMKLSEARGLQVRAGSTVLLTIEVSEVGDGEERPGQSFLDQLVDDLAVIASEMHTPLEVPDSISGAERLEIRRLRLLLEGYVILEPAFASFTGTLDGTTDSVLEKQMLNHFALASVSSSIVYTVLGNDFRVPGLYLYTPAAEVLDGAEIVRALHAGEATGREITIRPVDGTPFWAYLPERMTANGRPQKPVALNVRGHDEPLLPADGPSTLLTAESRPGDYPSDAGAHVVLTDVPAPKRDCLSPLPPAGHTGGGS